MRVVSVLGALVLLSCAEAGFCTDVRSAQDAVRPGPLARYLALEAPQLALVGVTVIDGSGAPPARNQTVVVGDGRIVAISDADSAEVSAVARRLNLPGHTVIPGLVGMHNHTHMPGIPLMAHTAPRLYLAAGVTTIATAGSADADGEIALARAIAAGATPGPRIFPSAPYVTGPDRNGPGKSRPQPPMPAGSSAPGQRGGAAWVKLYRTCIRRSPPR